MRAAPGAGLGRWAEAGMVVAIILIAAGGRVAAGTVVHDVMAFAVHIGASQSGVPPLPPHVRSFWLSSFVTATYARVRAPKS